jgi:hypothetical protein
MLAFGRAFHPRRSGDVLFAMQPYFVHAGSSGTTHGAPWRYDSHIPLIFLGAGMKHDTVNRRIHVAALAPTVSRVLGLPEPPASEEEALEEAIRK